MILVIQPDADVPAGLVAEELESFGVPYRLLQVWRDDAAELAADTSGIILLGGSMSVHDRGNFAYLATIQSLLKTALERQTPFLGICLGAQMLALAGGASVVEGRWGEQGVTEVRLCKEAASDRLFRGLPDLLVVFHWHDDSFDIPQSSTLLASAAICPNQAFRLGSRAWGVQFHPEVTPQIIGRWAALAGLDEHESQQMQHQWQQHESQFRRTMKLMMENFLEVCHG